MVNASYWIEKRQSQTVAGEADVALLAGMLLEQYEAAPETVGDWIDGERGTLVGQGEAPFAILADGRVVMGRFRTTFRPQWRGSLDDEETTAWALTLDGASS